jgi:hypothetical protein
MSLGGKNTTTQSIDPALKEAAMANLASAQKIGQLGFVPYTEATVAGMQPGQLSAMQSTNLGAEAFGLGQTEIPTGGDLSPYQIYQTALSNMAPGQRAFIESMFINPLTGAAPTMQFGMQPAGSGAGGGGGSNRASNEPRQGSASSRNTKYDTYSVDNPRGGGSGSNFASSGVASRLPGGVNTRNPSSAVNRAAASMSGPQKAPTASSRPAAKSTSTRQSVSDSRAKASRK